MNDSVEIGDHEVAIVGMSLRVPGADTLDSFWEMLREGREGISLLSDEQLLAAGTCPKALKDPAFVKAKGILKDVEFFDAAFFGILPKDAEHMDPQQRLFLETAWSALEDAGYDPGSIAVPAGVFAGEYMDTYLLSNLCTNRAFLDELIASIQIGSLQTELGNDKDYLATRVSFKLNLRGPAMTLQSACSTSLVAVCQAVDSLSTHQCDLALAGGVTITLPQIRGYFYKEGGMLSPDGHCRTFDADSKGTVFSNGVGVVALKRLSEALRDRDHIYAVIKGTAVNNDGGVKLSYTAPSVEGQAAAISMAHSMAGVTADSIGYVEAHGTGTPLGDPIEVEALTRAFRETTDKAGYCAIGSLKTNIGHMDVASGVCGLIKTALSLSHRMIPPSLHFTRPNPKIDFANSPFFVNTKLRSWERGVGPRRAGVSAFGVGGTNAHVVLEEAPAAESSPSPRPLQLCLFSGRSDNVVSKQQAQLEHYLSSHTEVDRADAAYTLAVGRKQFRHRGITLVPTCGSASPVKSFSGVVPASPPPVSFMFPGQGAQHVGMARQLYDGEPAFREIVDAGASLLRPIIGLDLKDVMFADVTESDPRAERINQTAFAQPAMFIVEYALARLWMTWGVVPHAMIGHSLGEFVAACLAGVFSFEEGLKLMACRGRLMGALPGGAMLSVKMPEAELLPLLDGALDLSVVNGDELCVVSGSCEQIQQIQNALEANSVVTRRLRTSHGFHSRMMDPALEPFGREVARVALNAPRIQIMSSATGRWLTDEEAVDPGYWTSHLRRTVRFGDAVRALIMESDGVMLEVGPGQTLATLARQSTKSAGVSRVILSSLGHAEAGGNDFEHLYSALGRLWISGVPVDWNEFYSSESRFRVSLPSYPFERKRFWIDPTPSVADVASPTPLPDRTLVEPEMSLPAPAQPSTEAASSESIRKSAARVDQITGRLMSMVRSQSGLDANEIVPSLTFLEMGLDSLFILQFSRDCGAEFGVPVSFRQLVGELPTIARVAEYLDGSIPEDQQLWKEPATASQTLATRSVDAGDKSDLAAVRAQLEVLSRQIESLARALSKGGGPNALGNLLTPPGQEPASACQILPLTGAQHEIWLASQLGDDISRTYNDSYLVEVHGSLNLDALGEILQEIVDRHDALRTTFLADGNGQRVAPALKAELIIVDLVSSKADSDLQEALAKAVRDTANEVFNLSSGPLFRFRLFKIGEQRHVLLLNIHHLVADGWSWSVILLELSEFYSARAEGRPFPVRSAMQYRDYVDWLALAPQVARGRAAENFWLDKLADKPPQVELPADRPRPPLKTFRADGVRYRVDQRLFARLGESARKLNVTVFELLMASFAAWLHRVTGRDDMIVAVPHAGQVAANVGGAADARRLVGHCVNMLPIRIRCCRDESFRSLLDGIKTVMLDARENQEVSFNSLINSLKWPRDPSRMPLASVSLNLIRSEAVQLMGLVCKTRQPPKAYNFFDLTVDMLEAEEYLEFDAKFNADLYDSETVLRWMAQWDSILAAGIDSPLVNVGELSVLPETERHKLLFEWNNTQRSLSKTGTALSMIEAQARVAPDRVAVSFEGSQLTYSQVLQQAGAVAGILHSHGVGPGSLVGVFVERTELMVSALLSVWKAGAAYVPLDPAYPTERIQMILEDARPRLLLSQTSLLEKLPPGSIPRIALDDLDSSLEGESVTFSSAGPSQDDLAYVIFTSGSTGRPKGVEIQHRALANFLESMRRKPGLTSNDAVLAVTTLSFDIAGLELWLPLTSSARVVIARKETAMDGLALMRELKENNITLLQATPITWRILLEAGWKGDRRLKALCGGEALPSDLAELLSPLCAELWNMYGPTETTIWSTCQRLSPGAPVSIGGPIDNTQIYIVDARDQLQPVGVPGELLIGGEGLARGYLNRPELTAEKFVVNPFGDGRLYRTGDLARWRADGAIECLGRMDHQVKLRGFRIELGEIEAALCELGEVRQAVVVLHQERLVAYYVSESGLELDVLSCRDALRRRLPDYMVPAAFVHLSAVPLTPNGKVDRKALPSPDLGDAAKSDTFEAPRDETERQLVTIWERLLQRSNIGVHDNFFDLGGHSLLAVKLFSEIEKMTGRRLPLAVLFESATVASLARKLDADSPGINAWSSLVPIQPSGSRPRLYCVHGAGGNILLYRDLVARLGSDYPVFGFQSRGLDRRSAPLASIEEMAAAYASELVRAQPVGPYCLAGYCMGGMVALEMGRLLKRQGREVALVALLDTYNPVEARDAGGASILWQRLRFHVGNLLRLGPRHLGGYLREKLRVARDGELAHLLGFRSRAAKGANQNVVAASTEEDPGGNVDVQRVNDQAVRSYRPVPYEGSIVVFKTRVNYSFLPDPNLGWGRMARGGVEVVELPVNPHAMLVAPFVQHLARELQTRIDAVRGPSAS